MSDAILLLRLEHGNMTRLLDRVEEQVRNLEQGTAVNHKLLAEAINYLQNYPDQCHHPKEDLVLEVMARRDPKAAVEIGDLAGEHRKISDLTAQAARALEQVGSIRGSDVLLDALRSLTTSYRNHMSMEESVFFPRALQVLDRSDWSSIDFDLFDRDDPLFDHAQEQRFRALRESITGNDDHEEELKEAHKEIKLLNNLTDIDDFNLAMERLGSKLRLLRFSEGVYGMEREGSLLAYIPSQEVVQAVRCAYFYAKGAEQITLA